MRLPKALVDALRLAPGDELNVVAASRTEIVVDKISGRDEFLRRMDPFRWPAAHGDTFDRDEANER